MNYFVTGATGFIGRNLVSRLLQREGTVYALVRAGSRGRLEELRTGWGADGEEAGFRLKRFMITRASRAPSTTSIVIVSIEGGGARTRALPRR